MGDARRAGQSGRLADLAHRRRIPTTLERVANDLEYAALARGESFGILRRVGEGVDRAACLRVLSALPAHTGLLWPWSSRDRRVRRVLSSPTVVVSADTIKHLFERVSTLSDPRCTTRTCVRSNDCTSTATGGRDDNCDDPADDSADDTSRCHRAGDPWSRRIASPARCRAHSREVRSLVRTGPARFSTHGTR